MYLLVADDLTGGNDAGIQFVKSGLDVWIALSSECAAEFSSRVLEDAAGKERIAADETASSKRITPSREMFVINTNTRNMTKEAAAENVARVVSAFVKGTAVTRPEMVFKKIDSTLRGNIGAETDALMREFSFEAVFLTPAYPGQGRVVRNGILLVNGVPVHETGFADDPLTPIRESRIANIVGNQSKRTIGEVDLETVAKGPESITAAVASMQRDGVELFVFDAENAEHLASIAASGLAMREKPLFIGSAGLAEALAGTLPGETEAKTGSSPKVERVFYVCGSAHQMTRAQVERLCEAGVPVVSFPGAGVNGVVQKAVENPMAGLVADLADTLRKGDVVLASPAANGESSCGASFEDGMALSDSLGRTALLAIHKAGLAPGSLALVMTGGETAYAVLKEICTGLSLEKELFPGIALCKVKGGEWDSLRVVTKAGGFGKPETLVDVLHMLQTEKHPGDYR